MVGAVVAAAAAVASVGIGIYSTVQAGKAQSQANNIANTQLGLEENLNNEQQPYRDQLNALLKDPSSVAQLPGYQFNKQQGEDSVARQFAANPGGAEGVALTKFGQDYASSAYQQQVQMLTQLSGLTNNPASYGSSAVGANSNAIGGAGQNFNQIQQLLAQSGSIAKLFGPQGSYDSAGTPGAGPSYGGVYPGYTVTSPGGP